MPVSPEMRAAAQVSKAWPYEEARKLLGLDHYAAGREAAIAVGHAAATANA